MSSFKAASALAAREAQAPGSFHVKLYDWLYKLSGNDISENVRVLVSS